MSLGLVPPGATITDVYYAVPQHYTEGDSFPTFIAAVRAALAKADDIKRRGAASYPLNWDRARVEEEAERCAKTACVVDLRWKITWPGGGLDAVIERKNVRHLSADHCDRMEALQTLKPSLG
jgi:hypothetical protein